MNDLANTQEKLKLLLGEGLDVALKSLGEMLLPASLKYNVFAQLRSRYSAYLSAIMIGGDTPHDLELIYNGITNSYLLFIDSLHDNDLKPIEQPANAPNKKHGELLYHIPHTMQLDREHTCRVRIAYQLDKLIEGWTSQTQDLQRSIRVAEVMAVELLNTTENQTFAIRAMTDTIQFLDEDSATEWLFFVCPKKLGELPLLLKVSVIEVINGREIRKDVIIEEHIIVAGVVPIEAEVFKKSGQTFNFQTDVSNMGLSEVPHLAPAPAQAQQPADQSSYAPLLRQAGVMVLIFFVVGGLGIGLFLERTRSEFADALAQSKKKFDTENDRLKDKNDSLTSVNEILRKENEDWTDRLASRTASIAEKGKPKRSKLASRTASIAEKEKPKRSKQLESARSKIATLTKSNDKLAMDIRHLEEENSRLVTANEVLTNANQNLNLDLAETKAQLEGESTVKAALVSEKKQLENDNQILANKVDMFLAVKVSNINIKEVKVGRNGKDRSTSRRSHKTNLSICFNTEPNEVVPAGEETFYLRIIDPKGTSLDVESLRSDVSNDKPREEGFRYTTAALCNYTNSVTEVCGVWQPDQHFIKGKYTIEVYNKGYLVGADKFDLE